jgi:hypothetical protein
MPSDWGNSDDDFVDSPDEYDPNAFRIWDPLQKPVTVQYTTDYLHSARGILSLPQQNTSNILVQG